MRKTRNYSLEKDIRTTVELYPTLETHNKDVAYLLYQLELARNEIKYLKKIK